MTKGIAFVAAVALIAGLVATRSSSPQSRRQMRSHVFARPAGLDRSRLAVPVDQWEGVGFSMQGGRLRD